MISRQQHQKIIECQTLDEMETYWASQGMIHFFHQRKNKFIQQLQSSTVYRKQPILPDLLNNFLTPIYFALDVIWYSSFSILAIGLISGTGLILGIIAGLFYMAEKKYAKKDVDETDNYLLMCFKADTLDIALADMQKVSHPLAETTPMMPFKKLQLFASNLICITTPLFGLYLSVGAIIGSNLTAIASATTISSFMLGPIGIPIALTTALLVGAFCFYKQYQRTKYLDFVEEQTTALKNNYDAQSRIFNNHYLYLANKQLNRNSAPPHQISQATKANDQKYCPINDHHPQNSKLEFISKNHALKFSQNAGLFADNQNIREHAACTNLAAFSINSISLSTPTQA